MYCNECVLKAESFDSIRGRAPLVRIKQRQDRFIFRVETTGAIPPEDVRFPFRENSEPALMRRTSEQVVMQAMSVLLDKLDVVATAVREEQQEVARESAAAAPYVAPRF
jgi:hypothetical protein